MKALLLTEYRKLEPADVPRPVPGPGELLVRVKACGICGSDIHGYDGGTGRRIPPLIMGHEAAGEVAETGPGVTGFSVGDRVTFDSTISCGACWYCQRGQINLCQNRQVLGVSCDEYRRHGAFAEYVLIPQRIAYHLPETLSYEHAALLEAVSVAVHAVNRTPIRMGDTAVVIGSGMIGLLVLQALRHAGCGRIIAIDLDDNRLKLARTLGADVTFNARTEHLAEAVADLTGGRGADVALEAVGATAPIQTAIQVLRRGGALTLVGNLAPRIDLPLQQVVTRELSLYGSCASSNDYPLSIELMATGKIQVEPLISACAPLAEGPQWFERLYAHEAGLMKVILQP